MNHSQALKARWKPAWTNPANHSLETAFLTALHFLDTPAEAKAKLTESGTLTSKGIIEGYRAEISKTVSRLKQDAAFVKRQRDEIAFKRSQMGKVVADKTDAAGQLRRMELRQHLKSLNQAEQAALLWGPDKADFVEAVLETSSILSGIKTPQLLQQVRDQYIADKHGTEIAELEDRDEMLEAVEVAQTSAANAIKMEATYATRVDKVAYVSPEETARWFEAIA